MKSELARELARVSSDAYAKRHVWYDVADALLSALASKGVDGMPDAEWLGIEATAARCVTQGISRSDVDEHVRAAHPLMRAEWTEKAKPYLDIIRSRLAPILAAKDAERDALRAELERREEREGAWHEATQAAGPDDELIIINAARARVAELEALLHKLIDVDERGNCGPLAMRERAFVELGDVCVEARSLLGRPFVPGPLASCAEEEPER